MISKRELEEIKTLECNIKQYKLFLNVVLGNEVENLFNSFERYEELDGMYSESDRLFVVDHLKLKCANALKIAENRYDELVVPF